jgi:hypothetical protein
VRSRTVAADAACPRDGREFVLEGPNAGVARALGVVCDGVARYKELCEGRFAGQAVARTQLVANIDFCYQPPPRQLVPFAASIKPHPSK